MNQCLKRQSEVISTGTRTWLGFGLLCLSSLGFTTNVLIANMALKEGIDVNTVNAVRYFIAIVLLFIFYKSGRKTLKLPPRERYKALALGIPVFMIGIGYLGATQYIPVSLAVLIFYTAPFFVAIVTRFTENEPITIIRMLAIIIAFIGLSLALEIRSVNTLDWRGIIFGFVASIGGTGFVTFSSLTLRTADSQKVNFHCLAAGAVLFAAFLLITGGPTNAISPPGLLKLIISGVLLAFAYVTFFNGLEIIGPFKTSMLMNMEPIFTIILAAILLGERLSPLQLAGAGLVIAGIILITGRIRNIGS